MISMAGNKKDNFDGKEQEIADFARALAHPARVKILKTLARRKTCICGEIVDVMPLAQSTVSQHLKELKKIGLIIGEIEGPRSCSCINRERLETLAKLYESLIRELKE
jgi:ArsR family transcriptional regulator, arsenate/arsenite/antimonite-responsive transcriptional repressor